jgi:Tol biopolymer transport system component
MRARRHLAAFAAALAFGAAACGGSAATPQIIYVTPAPAATTAATASAAASATPSPTLAAGHGQYLLYLTWYSAGGDLSKPTAWLGKPNGNYVKKVADGTAAPNATPPAYNLDATWSHDGSVVHVVRWPDCVPSLSDYRIASWTETAAIAMTKADNSFAWSPDDTKIAYSHFAGADVNCETSVVDGRHDLLLMTSTGGSKVTVKANVSYAPVAWLPDGSALIAKGDSGGWYKVGISDGSATSLGIDATSLKVSPDGKRVAYMTAGLLYVRDLAGGTPTSLGKAYYDFAWSPDGSSLAFPAAPANGVNRVDVLNVTTQTTVTVYDALTRVITWSPDGSRLAFINAVAGGVYVVPSSGGAATSMGSTSGTRQLYWQP